MMRTRTVNGHVTRVEICACGGVVLSVGPVSLRLDAAAAADVASTMAVALFEAPAPDGPGPVDGEPRGAEGAVASPGTGRGETN
jgi:hypothetical protein